MYIDQFHLIIFDAVLPFLQKSVICHKEGQFVSEDARIPHV